MAMTTLGKVDLDISALSAIRHTMWQPSDNNELLVVEFVGEYRIGGKGNPDADYIAAFTLAGTAAYEPLGLILDFRGMSYKWGNRLLRIFSLIERMEPREESGPFPVFVVASPEDEGAYRSLLEFGCNDHVMLGCDLETAIRRVQDRIDQT